jgi:flagellar basal-body rod protein FlgC
MFGNFDVSVSGMRAQRVRLDTISQNLANVDSLLNERNEFEPYRRRVALFARGAEGPGTPGVRVARIVEDPGPLRLVHDPDSEYADAEGNVPHPNVDLVTEHVNAIEASRAFEANVAAFELTKSMIGSALRILA